MFVRTLWGIALAGVGALSGLLCPANAAATTYSVGSGAGCTHATVQEAINAAVIDVNAPHLIKLVTGTIGVPNGLSLHDSVAEITIEGGYTSCAGALGSNTRTVLDATGGADGTVLDIRFFGASPMRTITLARLDITGGTGETGIFASSEGAGLELRGNLRINLRATRVRDNRAYRAAGVLIQGGPGSVVLSLDQGSAISGNVADTDGGGVWCIDLGAIRVAGSSTIEFNQAGRDGGGLWLGTRCAVRFGTQESSTIGDNLLSNNTAGAVYGGRGGGLFLQSNTETILPVEFRGSPAHPMLVLNNQALSGPTWAGEGGALYLEGNASTRQRVELHDTVLINNTVQGEFGAAISARQAIDLTLQGSPARCSGLFGFGSCSVIAGSNANAILVRDTSSTSEALAPLVRISRTRFTQNNAAELGLIYFRVDFNSNSNMVIDSSIFDANVVDGLIYADRFVALRYSTLSGNTIHFSNFAPAVFHSFLPFNSTVREFDLRGSVIWQPGIILLRNESGGGPWQATHDGCLLSADLTNVQPSAWVRTSDPMLGADFTPAAGSPALDVCGYIPFSPATDAYGGSRPIDQPGVPNVFGAYDLGAVERQLPDLIFADDFE